MKYAALLAIVAMLAGCGAAETVNIGPGVHALSYKGEPIELESAEEVLTAEADAACPEGWTKTAEKSSVGAAGRRLDWYIRCN